MKTIKEKADIAAVNGILVMGSEKPKKYVSLISSPKNTTTATLKPTDVKIISRNEIPFNLSRLIAANPGMKVRKTKTAIPLMKGISSQIAILAKIVKIGIINSNHFTKII